MLREVPVLGLSVLAHPHEHAARSLAARSGDRFAGIATSATGGAVHLDGSVAQLTCSVDGETVTGDHLLVLLRVHSARSNDDADPLVFHRSGFTGVRTHGEERT
ncbi:Nitrilotriacetate monooxygenase component B [Pseudonocardia sp. Ae168_Ps1]|nr:Nitrilotriacetate monooxygenase component B [Pseudonocardia sp. Ae150A_Ps1]OLL82888.1 Nitrilotriacetate monooxygenase component B [Pseudonocardia sp. Ae168_Ps1]OLL83000.1 Nitrilotriacetate monooxygenase component B [Pseudonocardia sp. Ae263_Ps1]OLL90962.1 Nitrilotriacetate monooxygenase component B [Pseudonocardia sp. Ae356_Ps1]